MKLQTLKKTLALTLTLSLAITTASTLGFAAKREVNIFAAASLRYSLAELERKYEASHKNVDLKFNYAGSGTLSTQIINGAKADIFISADTKNMDLLQNKGMLDNKTIKNLLGNKLVLITPKSNTTIKSSQDLASLRSGKDYLTIGEPKSVPAGQYATEYLKNQGVFDKLSGKINYAKDVTAVLTMVSSNNSPAGFVYLSDALTKKNTVKVVETAKAGTHTKIVYPSAIIKDSPNRADANKFYKYVTGKTAKKVFLKYGFEYLN